LAHPCSVLLQRIASYGDEYRGTPQILEYETTRDLPLSERFAFPGSGRTHYDELIVRTLTKTEVASDSLRLTRTFLLDWNVMHRSTLVRFVLPQDGYEKTRRRAHAEDRMPNHLPSIWLRIGAVRVETIGETNYDAEYLHMRQFWQKGQRAGMFGRLAMTLLTMVAGSALEGPVYRWAAYLYNDKEFALNPPVIYRSFPIETRPRMPNCVGIFAAFIMGSKAEILGMALEPGFETEWRPILTELTHNVLEYAHRVAPEVDTLIVAPELRSYLVDSDFDIRMESLPDP